MAVTERCVVCGRGEIAETFSPMSALIKVDFPAFGRPRMAMYQTFGIKNYLDFFHSSIFLRRISEDFIGFCWPMTSSSKFTFGQFSQRPIQALGSILIFSS